MNTNSLTLFQKIEEEEHLLLTLWGQHDLDITAKDITMKENYENIWKNLQMNNQKTRWNKQKKTLTSWIQNHSKSVMSHDKGLPRQLSGKESACQCKRHRFNPWVGKIPWRRIWQPTAVFCCGEFHGQRSLVGYSPWDHKESDMTEATEHKQQKTY